MTYEEAMQRAKALEDQLFSSRNRNSQIPNKAIILMRDDGWLNLVADALYSAALPEDQRCPRPINAATNESAEWCKSNGLCGCIDVKELRKEYGELLYPVTRWTDETQVD